MNLGLTMLLGGLWHGAAWTFVVWGGLHGLYLVVNHGWRHLTGDRLRVPMPFAWALTFLCVVVGWVFFRAPSVERAFTLLRSMAGGSGAGAFVLSPTVGWIGIASMICLLAPVSWRWAEDQARLGAWWSPPVLGTALIAALLCMTRVSEFLYFQF